MRLVFQGHRWALACDAGAFFWCKRMAISLDSIIISVFSALMGLLIYLARSYFERVHADLLELKGAMHALNDGLHKNTISVAKLQGDVKALWRFADGAFGRVSDKGGTNADISD